MFLLVSFSGLEISFVFLLVSFSGHSDSLRPLKAAHVTISPPMCVLRGFVEVSSVFLLVSFFLSSGNKFCVSA